MPRVNVTLIESHYDVPRTPHAYRIPDVSEMNQKQNLRANNLRLCSGVPIRNRNPFIDRRDRWTMKLYLR